eukprot:4503977-Prymnesium_polylepis.1
MCVCDPRVPQEKNEEKKRAREQRKAEMERQRLRRLRRPRRSVSGRLRRSAAASVVPRPREPLVRAMWEPVAVTLGCEPPAPMALAVTRIPVSPEPMPPYAL